jgi:hypothetical protein
MRHAIRSSLRPPIAAAAAVLLLAGTSARAQISGGADVNLTAATGAAAGDKWNCAIAVNPTNKDALFVACNASGGTPFGAYSTDGGATWSKPSAFASGQDPALAWDGFGNLYAASVVGNTIAILLSVDGGATFSALPSQACTGCGRPSVAASPGAAASAIWVAWHQVSLGSGSTMATGAAVTGSGAAHIGAFSTAAGIPGAESCSHGDLAIAPNGAVVLACESPSNTAGPASILVFTRAAASSTWAPTATAITTGVGGQFTTPAQARKVDAGASLAYDRAAPTPRLYLVYADVASGSNTDVMVRHSDDEGASWSAATRVSDSAPASGKFLPRVAVSSFGNVAACWYDTRNAGAGLNPAAQVFCNMGSPTTFPAFADAAIADVPSPTHGGASEFGDTMGLAYFMGVVRPAWVDPRSTTAFEPYTDAVTGDTGYDHGDPHITTAGGVRYDFQGAGEFVSLRGGDGSEIQTRQTAVSTAGAPGADPYDGLATCVSLNTAVAARVGKRRVTFQPNVSGVPDPSGMQLRVDGALVALPSAGLDLGSGGSVSPSSGSGIQLQFPDGTVLVVTPLWWASQARWYLNLDVFHPAGLEGIMGAIPRGSWLPALPDGSSMGPMPAALHQRYVDLYQRFGEAWRVTAKTSLFDYAAGTSTATFADTRWPPESPPCASPDGKPVKPGSLALAEEACRPVLDKGARANCLFDVAITGEPGFARLYRASQRVRLGSTTTALTSDRASTPPRRPVTFTAVVRLNAPRRGATPAGTVLFSVDSGKARETVKLDRRGIATWRTSGLAPGEHQVTARYLPDKGSQLLPSRSAAVLHLVRERKD